MEEKTLQALVAAGAIKKVRTWVTLDAAAKWVRNLGIGGARVNLTHWQPDQRELSI